MRVGESGSGGGEEESESELGAEGGARTTMMIVLWSGGRERDEGSCGFVGREG